MNTRHMAGIGIAVVWGMTGAVSSAWAQGSLTPPGAPNPGMRTLMQVEPRVPIRTAPYTITESGSYYLTANLTSTTHGITIQADDVTLDLMGFTIAGDRGSGDRGIWLSGATNAFLRNIVVRGGTVRDFQYGLFFDCAQDSRIESLTVCSNSLYGIYLDGSYGGACNGNALRDCVISGNGQDGVRLLGQSGICNGNTVAHCAIQGNAGQGIYLSGYGGACNGNTLSDCAISGNGSLGILLSGESAGQCDGNTVADCAVSGNGNVGIMLKGLSGQCNGNTLRNCAICGNGSTGVELDGRTAGHCDGNAIAGCAVSSNLYEGVWLRGTAGSCGGNTVEHCVLSENYLRDIHADSANGNRIEDNRMFTTTDTLTWGVQTVTSSNNLIVRNSSVGHLSNYVASATDTCGPIVSDIGTLSTNGAAMSPWANFSR